MKESGRKDDAADEPLARGEHEPMIEIPFNRPSAVGREVEYIAQSPLLGPVAGGSSFGRRCQEWLERMLGVRRTLLTTSCTHALEMAAMLVDVQPGHEVIVPSYAFVSAANAFVLRGGRPVFCDVRPDTLNIDETRLEASITPRTRAIVVVHYAGVGCEMDAILEIAERHHVPVIEDNAHGLFGKYRGRPLGTLGPLATLSFHETKNITCGEGGALLLSDEQYFERAEIIRDKGTNRAQFFRGQVDKYSWVDLGSSYVISDILAAFLYGQLEQWQAIQSRRRRIWEYYHQRLAGWAAKHRVGQPTIPAHCDQGYHIYYLLLPSLELRQALIAHLRTRGIQAVFHYLPLHLSRMGVRFGGKPGDCPVTERIGDTLLRLPFYNELSENDQERVVTAIEEFTW